MGKLILCFAAYALLLTGGWRAIKEQGSKGELALFVLIVAGCVYMSVAKLFKIPLFSVISLHNWAFLSFGKWVSRMLGTEG